MVYMMSMGGIYRRRSLDLDLGVLHCTVLYCTYIEGMSGAGAVVGQRRGEGWTRDCLPACLVCVNYI